MSPKALAPFVKALPQMLLGLGLVFRPIGPADAAEGPKQSSARASVRDEAMAFALLSAQDASKNVVFSPFSLSMALGLAYVGAGGPTEKEIAKAMGYKGSKSEIVKTLGEQINTAPAELEIANRAWFSNLVALKPAYTRTLDGQLRSRVETVDFLTPQGRKAAVEKVNEWVRLTTKDKIDQLVTEDMLTEASRFILANAIYFGGQWKSAFTASDTTKAPFKRATGASVEVPFLVQKSDYAYGQVKGKFEYVVLPYSDPRLAMTIVLPDAKSNVTELAKSLGSRDFIELQSKAKTQRVALELPKFRFGSTFDKLDDGLEKLGMTTALDRDKADFSNLNDKKDPLWIDKVVQKVVIEVDEKGTEASAATAVTGLGTLSFKPQPPSVPFRADRPFLFAVTDSQTKRLLFVGWVSDPSATR